MAITQPTAPTAPAAPATPVAPKPPVYTYSTGNAFATFAKFNGKNYFIWRRNMMTQLRALGQWEVVDGSIKALMPAIPNHPTPDKTHELNTWKLQVARAYAEIALQLDDDYGEVIAMINNPHDAWMMLESSYGSQQSGIQAVINAELTLVKWDSQTPIQANSGGVGFSTQGAL